MRTEGALTPAPPPGSLREDSRARGSPLPAEDGAGSLQTMVKRENLGVWELAGEGVGPGGVGEGGCSTPLLNDKKEKLPVLGFSFKKKGKEGIIRGEGSRCSARQRARGFHAPPGPRLQLPGSRRSPGGAAEHLAGGVGGVGEESRALLYQSLKISSRRGASGWGVGPCWTCVMYHLQAHLIGR